jgi:hypothetical protein
VAVPDCRIQHDVYMARETPAHLTKQEHPDLYSWSAVSKGAIELMFTECDEYEGTDRVHYSVWAVTLQR